MSFQYNFKHSEPFLFAVPQIKCISACPLLVKSNIFRLFLIEVVLHIWISGFSELIEAKFFRMRFFILPHITFYDISAILLVITFYGKRALSFAWTKVQKCICTIAFNFRSPFFDESCLFGCVLLRVKVLSVFYEVPCIL